ncbi:hypothetical protein EUX98_g1379 [Antrodiella citrinella]|uniref:Uncharacterized protein n=1 Tax=Antrodiella citrinella TaxID=2447956 RepID=A0A4S4N319_9APHY|nr:hypothetical protein EUX98_g1379 [Antrodiella citrinella]
MLYIFGSEEGDSSWVSSVPFMLPPLPNLSDLYICNVDLAQQHPDLPKLFSKLFLGS